MSRTPSSCSLPHRIRTGAARATTAKITECAQSAPGAATLLPATGEIQRALRAETLRQPAAVQTAFAAITVSEVRRICRRRKGFACGAQSASTQDRRGRERQGAKRPSLINVPACFTTRSVGVTSREVTPGIAPTRSVTNR